MRKPPRPSGRELHGKIRNAIVSLEAGRRDFGTLRHWASDKCDLGLNSSQELWELLPKLLNEIKNNRPETCYAGTNPPQRSYQGEPALKGEELWAFSWHSLFFGKKMYLKFVLTKNRRDEWHYFHVDCHQDAPK